MGDFRVRKINDAIDRKKMYQHVLADVEAFEWMLKEKMFETEPLSIGAEQELCLVDNSYAPASTALEILDSINDEHFTNELALFNLEINLDPLRLQNSCFSGMETALLDLLEKGKKQAAKFQSKILQVGILPTLKYRHLQFDYMTPVQRYETLSKTLSDIRGANFQIYLQGVDEIIMSLGTVLFEACNTSFQLHLQIAPDDFVNQHNWSQMIAGPVLSACTNSPLLFGNELWAETRIALFKQSLDTRSSKKFLRKKLPRVYFGKDWLRNSASELWKNDIMRFPLIVTSDDFQDAKAVLESGGIPDLRAIRLHNGTTYTWNRLCYGFSKTKPHLRIECRYLPSGPTAIDEIANFAFWIGLMKAEPIGGLEFWKKQDFKIAKDNLIKAARTGLNSVFHWFGQNISAKKLLLEQLIPMAADGLNNCNVSESDINKYLQIFEDRVKAEQTGSDWMVRNFRSLSKRFGNVLAEKEIVRQMLHFQDENLPLHQWPDISKELHPVGLDQTTVEQLMSTDIFSIPEDGSIELAKRILDWNNIHHLPVENKKGNLVGLITDGIIERLEKESKKDLHFAHEIMLDKLITVQAPTSISEAEKIMEDHQLSGLPVVYNDKLVGMITQTDIKKNMFIDV